MNIEQAAAKILTMAEITPTASTREETTRMAKLILDAFEWVDCDERLPAGEQMVAVKYPSGGESEDWYDNGFKCWYLTENESHEKPVKWRPLL